MSASFRPDIEGLRALAVAGVVAFHFGLSDLPGGFTGVDIFFVISGYLITGQLLREIAEDGRLDL
ncbi:MAG: acyltransferase, partial [Mesorhizobium sp.]|uniref:acyltransferase family protein n=1 Tax=Mesorhizobium sp. TaxID=1871066 RepID=UPI000FE9C770